MPIVNVKGVANPISFPDDMDITDIREVLRDKFAKRAISGQSDILSPQPNTAAPVEKTLVERAGQGVSDFLFDKGIISNRHGAQQVGKSLSALGEFLPGIGDAAAGDEFGRAVAQGDAGGIALSALGVIPVAGDLAKNALKVKFPKFKIGISENADNIILDKVIVPDELRGSGQGTEFMVQLIGNADKKGKAVGLTPSSDFGGNKKRLTEFYKRFGFVDNKGKNKDFTISESMIRAPRDIPINQSLPMDEIKKLPFREKAKVASEWKTGQPIKLSFARNTESSKGFPTGMDFGQDLEPSGRFMNVDFDDKGFNKNIPNWEFGEIEFKNPLVLEHKNTTSTGWKKDLSEMFGGSTGKRLTNKIKKAGHDGIITRDADGFNETISLK